MAQFCFLQQLLFKVGFFLGAPCPTVPLQELFRNDSGSFLPVSLDEEPSAQAWSPVGAGFRVSSQRTACD